MDHEGPVAAAVLADVSRSKRSGRLKSNWMVVHCHSRPRASSIWGRSWGVEDGAADIDA